VPRESHFPFLNTSLQTHFILALSRISPQVNVRVSISIVLELATYAYSWVWPLFFSLFVFTGDLSVRFLFSTLLLV